MIKRDKGEESEIRPQETDLIWGGGHVEEGKQQVREKGEFWEGIREGRFR